MKHRAKIISNILKLSVVIFIFYEYHYQSYLKSLPLNADECKGLLYVGITAFFILLPIDASIFVKNINNLRGIKKEEENRNDS